MSVCDVHVTQKMDSASNEMFEEFSTHVYTRQVNGNHEACESGKPSLGEQSNILESNIEKYEMIFAEYGDDTNIGDDNCDSQFQDLNPQIYKYTVHMQDTPHEMCSSDMASGTQEPAQYTTTCETGISNSLKVMTLANSQESENKETDISNSEGSLYLKEIISCDTEEKDNPLRVEMLRDETEVLKHGGKKLYIELNEKTIFALHGLDASLPIACDICQVDFDSMSKFDDHMRQHLETRFFMCQLCTKTYVSWQNLVAHRKVCHYGQFISCDGCARRKHHRNLGPVSFPIGNFPVGCEECHEGFRNANELNRHYRCHALDKHGNIDFEKTTREEYEQPTGITDVPTKGFGVTSDDCSLHSKGKEQRDLSEATNLTNAHKCNTHKKEMHSVKEFDAHKKKHIEQNGTYKCSFCRKIFKDKAKHKNNTLIHLTGKQYKCKECYKKFSSKSSVVHKYAHSVTEKYRCFNCQMEFNILDDMIYHVTKVHYQCPDIKLICDICTTNHSVHKFMDHYLLCHDKEKSQKARKQETNITCEVCSKVLPNLKALYHHVKTHTSTNQPYLCDVCGVILQDNGSFITHICSHKKDYNTDFSEINVTINENTKNDSEIIKNVKCFMCVYCGREFKNRTNLQLHVQRHTGEKPYKCRQCPMTFYTGQQLSIHQHRHKRELSYSCTICEKSFTSSTLLHAHRNNHSNMKKHVCPVCDKKFFRQSSYHKHMQTHSRVQTYKCDECSKTFLFKNRLILHKKTHEKGKLNFMAHQCSDCGQSFTSAQELENHHEEKCYLTMITFMSSSSDENKESSPLIFLNDDNSPTVFLEEQNTAF